MAKMIDFGYSRPGSREDDIVCLSRSWPWYAPELDYECRFKLRDAMKTDIYSFGMVSLYILFHDHFMGSSAGHSERKGDSELMISQWKNLEDKFVSKVGEVLRETIGISEALKISLWAFFQSTLPFDAESRNTDFKTLITYLS